ncbi:MAG: hypothetical protein L0177_08690 [Chloroflexi bacterium]|nr:hypothetical protein [Chloroflexota bacterium]
MSRHRLLPQGPVPLFLAAALLAVALFLLDSSNPGSIAAAQGRDSLLIMDGFIDAKGTRLSIHAPQFAPDGSFWQEVSGVWVIDRNRARENTGTVEDARAVIDAGESDVIARANVAWSEGFVGLVARYADEDNWLMAWFDGVEDIVLGKNVAGEFSELGRAPIDWGRPGRSRKVELLARGPVIKVFVSDRPLIAATVSELQENTLVGLFSRLGTDNRFNDFRVTSAASVGAPISTPEPGGPLVLDEFSDDEGAKLFSHSPEVAPEGSFWIEAGGAWVIEPEPFDDDEDSFHPDLEGKVTEVGGAEQDSRAVIDASSPNVSVQAQVSWRGGLVGLVTRYADEGNWLMAWFDGAGSLVIGKSVAGVFAEVARMPFDWGPAGETRLLQVTSVNTTVIALVDGETVASATVAELQGNTLVGLFSRGAAGSAFDDFRVTAE